MREWIKDYLFPVGRDWKYFLSGLCVVIGGGLIIYAGRSGYTDLWGEVHQPFWPWVLGVGCLIAAHELAYLAGKSDGETAPDA